ncbi:hypothetical protein EIP91_003229 [Steccherinum ochraceum]|uniref:Uncharacterized protein n=1 Tax=Steccherinum ochraceum TaxID=92696 RepID=A0A4R0S0G5_9APHY|nr:hypothetical protein EIP91_003229 [Steccherinum ochraceum]
MDFTNINDPAGVKALLDQLRSSQAWQQVVGTSTSESTTTPPQPTDTVSSVPSEPSEGPTDHEPPPVHVGFPQASASASASSSTSFAPPATVASLLSQLSAPAADPPRDFHHPYPSSTPTFGSAPAYRTPPILHPDPVHASSSTASAAAVPSSARKVDLRSCTFQQALPRLAQLAEDADFVAAVSKMKHDQNNLERRLFDERRGVLKNQQERIKTARTKASMIGSTISQFEADSMTSSFRRELNKFDTERALPAWDGLISKQQTELEGLGVPAMFLTTLTADRERQQRVVQVLTGMVADK